MDRTLDQARIGAKALQTGLDSSFPCKHTNISQTRVKRVVCCNALHTHGAVLSLNRSLFHVVNGLTQ